MSKDYGFKIVKSGSSINTTDVRNILVSSKFSMLKYHKDVQGTVTFTPGDADAFTDIQHNLGYVPAFIGYIQDFTDATKLRFISATPPTVSGTAIWSYADSTKIRVGMSLINSTYNQYPNNYTDLWSTVFSSNSSLTVGHLVWQGTDYGSTSGAARFTSVNIPQGTNIISALLEVYVGVRGAGTSDLPAKIYGIAEDNTADFGGDPMGRPKTTAVDIATWSLPAAGNYSNHDVTSIVQEIVNRAGWVSGNAMGFLVLDNGAPYDVWVYDSFNSSPTTKLVILYGDNKSRIFRTIIFKNKIF